MVAHMHEGGASHQLNLGSNSKFYRQQKQGDNRGHSFCLHHALVVVRQHGQVVQNRCGVLHYGNFEVRKQVRDGTGLQDGIEQEHKRGQGAGKQDGIVVAGFY